VNDDERVRAVVGVPGFLNLPRELVVALRDKGYLAWGAMDFGARDSGDVMHFDARVCGDLATDWPSSAA